MLKFTAKLLKLEIMRRQRWRSKNLESRGGNCSRTWKVDEGKGRERGEVLFVDKILEILMMVMKGRQAVILEIIITMIIDDHDSNDNDYKS